MKPLLLIPLLLVPYLLHVRYRYGMTGSISDTYRLTKKWEKVWFTLSLWAVAIPIMVVGFSQSNPDQVLILWLLAGGGICLVGAAPIFWKGGMEYKAHMVGAIGGIFSGILAVVIHCFSWFSLFGAILFILFFVSQKFTTKYRINNSTYWVELVALLVVGLVLFFT